MKKFLSCGLLTLLASAILFNDAAEGKGKVGGGARAGGASAHKPAASASHGSGAAHKPAASASHTGGAAHKPAVAPSHAGKGGTGCGRAQAGGFFIHRRQGQFGRGRTQAGLPPLPLARAARLMTRARVARVAWLMTPARAARLMTPAKVAKAARLMTPAKMARLMAKEPARMARAPARTARAQAKAAAELASEPLSIGAVCSVAIPAIRGGPIGLPPLPTTRGSAGGSSHRRSIRARLSSPTPGATRKARTTLPS